MKTTLTINLLDRKKNNIKLLLCDLAVDIAMLTKSFGLHLSVVEETSMTITCHGMQPTPLEGQTTTAQIKELIVAFINHLTRDQPHRPISRLLAECEIFLDEEKLNPESPPLPEIAFHSGPPHPNGIRSSNDECIHLPDNATEHPANLQLEISMEPIVGRLNILAAKQQIMLDRYLVHLPHGVHKKTFFEELHTVHATVCKTSNRRNRLLLDQQEMISLFEKLISVLKDS